MSKKMLLNNLSVFTLLVIIFKLPFFDLLLDTDSSVNAFFARQILGGEVLYDKFHPAHHLPGIYYTFALAFKLFGDNPTAPKLLLLAFTLASAWLIFLMGRSFFDDFTGILSACFYILGSSQVHLSGTTVEMEHFANLPLIATIFMSLILIRKNAHPFQFVWIGVLGAICILYKVILLGSLATAGISIFIELWLERKNSGSGKVFGMRLGAITVGIFLPIAFIGYYFFVMGLWDRLVLVFTLGFNYFKDTALMGILILPKPFGYPLFMLAMNNIALLTFGLLGTYRLIRRAVPLRTLANLTDFTLALWLVISFALAGLRGGGFPHYVLVVIPPLALASGVEISSAYKRWKITHSSKQAFIGAGIMTALIVVNFFWSNYELYRQYIPNKSGQVFYEKTTYQFSKSLQQPIIDYIKAHTTPDDLIYVWSNNKLQLYYYANRLPPIDIVWPSYVSATGPPERIFNPRTKYIIVDDIETISRPQWLLNGLEKNYQLETSINKMEIYRRNGS